jgi:amidohydrolase
VNDASESTSSLRQAVEAQVPQAVTLRRAIHQHPELAGMERQTADRIVTAMAPLGLEITTAVGGHGVVAVLRGGKPGPALAYRAELDAVPGAEAADLPFRSLQAGAGHLCGHDLHAAIAVGVAGVLAARADTMPGSVTFLFQPAEETLEGAAAMIAAGAVDNPVPDAIFALHSWPMPTGRVACGEGVGFAGLDIVEVHLSSTASAETASRIRTAIQDLATIAFPTTPQEFGALMQAFEADDGILQDAVYIAIEESASPDGLVVTAAVKANRPERYMGIREQIAEVVDRLAPSGSTLSVGGEPFPAMLNDPIEARRALAALGQVLGPEHVARYRVSSPFNGEDFALFQQRCPGVMILLGVADYGQGHLAVPHQPDFVADEGAIEVGILAATVVLLSRLGIDIRIG